MHKCSSSHEPCPCGFFHTQGNSFSMLFSMPNHNPTEEIYAYPITKSSSSVDCTLSLGTPSTRQTEDKSIHHTHRSGLRMSNLYNWDIFQTKESSSSSSAAVKHKTSRGSNNNDGSIHNNVTADPLFARRCANCDTTSTPLWRNGPRGPKSLCNACGIRYKKEERRATTISTTTGTSASANSWAHHSQTQKVTSMSPAIGNEFRFVEDDDDRDPNNRIPFLSWRLNVPSDRTNLVQDFS